jgi:phosphonate transport system substrate-binding protein
MSMKKVISIQALNSLILITVATLLGCQSPASTPQDFSPTVIWDQQPVKAPDLEQKPIQFGLGPWYTQEHTELYTRPLLRYLEEQTGYPFVLNLSENYEELVSNFENGHIDIADLSASLYDQLLEKSPGTSQYIATVSRPVGETMAGHYRGVIFTQKKRKIESLRELKGRTFAFVDRGSASGFKYPLALLISHGIEPRRDFSEIFYIGNHQGVVKAIATGQVFAGAVWDEALIKAKLEFGDVFKQLAQTSPIPREAWVAQTSMSPKRLASIQAALTALKPHTRLASGEKVFPDSTQFSGYVIEPESFYKVVGKTTAVVNTYLEKYPAQ